jgi:3-carboxy-cis,cis-muconate cycloisomerase
VLVVQLGGAAGTLAALGERGLEVADALAAELGLARPTLPWHAHRDRVAETATTLGLVAGTLGKMARDLALHGQAEVAELREPGGEGRGGSTSMPHKRNPVASAVVLAASARVPGLVATMLQAMVQEDERGLGGWHAEWETLPEILGLVGGAVGRMADVMGGLDVDEARMAANLEATRGLVLAEAVEVALAARVGRAAARRAVEAACRRAEADGLTLRAALSADAEAAAHLTPEELTRVFDPRRHLGVAERLVEAALDAHRKGRP